MSYSQPINYEAYSRRNDGGLPELRIRHSIVSNAVEALLRATPEPKAVSQKPAQETLATVTNIATRQLVDQVPDTESSEVVADAPVSDVLRQVELARQQVEDIWSGVEHHNQIQLQSAPPTQDNSYLDGLQAA